MEDLKQQYNYDRNISQTSEKVKQKTSKKKKKEKSCHKSLVWGRS